MLVCRGLGAALRCDLFGDVKISIRWPSSSCSSGSEKGRAPHTCDFLYLREATMNLENKEELFDLLWGCLP